MTTVQKQPFKAGDEIIINFDIPGWKNIPAKLVQKLPTNNRVWMAVVEQRVVCGCKACCTNRGKYAVIWEIGEKVMVTNDDITKQGT